MIESVSVSAQIEAYPAYAFLRKVYSFLDGLGTSKAEAGCDFHRRPLSCRNRAYWEDEYRGLFLPNRTYWEDEYRGLFSPKCVCPKGLPHQCAVDKLNHFTLTACPLVDSSLRRKFG